MLDDGYCVRETPDGGYIVGAQIFLSGSKTLLVRTDRYGDTVWARTFSHPNVSGPVTSIVVTDSGDYVATSGSGFNIFKVSSAGTLLWAKSHVPSDSGYATAVTAVSDGGFVLVGGRMNPIFFGLCAMKLDRNGDRLWTKMLGGPIPGALSSFGVCATSDSGCVVVGSVGGGSSYPCNMFLARLTAIGDTIWTRFFLTDGESYGGDVLRTPDGYFVASGAIRIPGASMNDSYLIKTTEHGDIVWSKRYGTMSVGDIAQTSDGGYILTGSAIVDSIPYASLLKTDSQGDTSWTRLFTGQYFSWASSVQQTSDSGYILTGTIRRNEPGAGSDILLIKTGTSGLVSVKGEFVIPPEFHLSQNYPNPFNPTTTFEFRIDRDVFVALKVFNLLGQEVATVVSTKVRAGEHRYRFDAKTLASGVYMYRLTIECSYSETRKFILIR